MVAVGNASCDCEPPSSTSVPVPEHMQPIIAIIRKEPFDGDGWLFDLKLDGFRGLADTVLVGCCPRTNGGEAAGGCV